MQRSLPVNRLLSLLVPLFTTLLLSACGGGILAEYVVQPLESINTSAQEYAPAFSLDGQYLFFVSDMVGGAGGHDCWYATRTGQPNAPYTTPRNLGPAINTTLHEGGIVLARDGATIYFSACNRPDGQGDCDIYAGRMEGMTITDVRNLGAIVNSSAWESQPSISSDGRTLYFASNRPGAVGEKGDIDIYQVTRNDEGVWSAPVNIGGAINTANLENAPTISADGTKLYFASNRPGGFGRYDLYVAERERSEGPWGTPQNLGERFNTERDERSITFSAAGDMACFVSATNEGNLDLYIAIRSATTRSGGDGINE